MAEQTIKNAPATNTQEVSKKRLHIKKGVFQAELNNFLMRELAEDGYSGVEVRPLKKKTECIIRATRTQSVVGEKGRRIRELTSLVQKRFGFAEGQLEMFAEKVEHRGLCAVAQCESLRYKLVGGLAVRRAAYGVVRFIMESGAKGCEVVVSGKIRGQRAKAMKFCDGLMIHSGEPTVHYIQTATRHVLLRQGVLGLKVKIMLPHDRDGRMGPKKYLPDQVLVNEPKDEEKVLAPFSKGNEPHKKQEVYEQLPMQHEPAHQAPPQQVSQQAYMPPQQQAPTHQLPYQMPVDPNMYPAMQQHMPPYSGADPGH